MKNARIPGLRIVGAKPQLMRHTLGRSDAGQALLELALVLPFLLLLVMGAVEVGIVAYAAIEVANAAEAGAMYGAQSRSTAASTNNSAIIQAAQNDAANLTSAGVSIVSATPTQWCACEGSTAASVSSAVKCSSFSVASCIYPSRVVEWVEVDTQATIDPLFHYPGLTTPVTVKGHSTIRVAQQ